MEQDELRKIFPEEEYVLESGEKVMVSPIPFRKLRVFGEAVSSLSGKLQLSDLAETDDPMVLGRVLSLAFDEIISIMCMVLNKEPEWFDRITISDGIGLGTLIVKQNFNEESKKKLIDLLAKTRSTSP